MRFCLFLTAKRWHYDSARGWETQIHVICALEKLIWHADTGAAMPEVDAPPQRFGLLTPVPHDRKRSDCLAV